jgi:hypothetical protein
LRGVEPYVIQTHTKARAKDSFRFHFLQFGETMATGREKDRKTRKKHRKNIARKKALVAASRGKAKKHKKG